MKVNTQIIHLIILVLNIKIKFPELTQRETQMNQMNLQNRKLLKIIR